MDATRNKRIFIPVPWLLIVLILAATFMLGRCSAPAAAQEPQAAPPTLDAAESAGYDFTDNAGVAVAEMFRNLGTTTTTTEVAVTPPQPFVQVVEPVAMSTTSSVDRWDALAQCESGGNWSYPPVAGGFSGGTMTYIGTWIAMGGQEFAPDAYLASREQQIVVNERILASGGWTQWPGCSRKFGWL